MLLVDVVKRLGVVPGGGGVRGVVREVGRVLLQRGELESSSGVLFLVVVVIVRHAVRANCPKAPAGVFGQCAGAAAGEASTSRARSRDGYPDPAAEAQGVVLVSGAHNPSALRERSGGRRTGSEVAQKWGATLERERGQLRRAWRRQAVRAGPVSVAALQVSRRRHACGPAAAQRCAGVWNLVSGRST